MELAVAKMVTARHAARHVVEDANSVICSLDVSTEMNCLFRYGLDACQHQVTLPMAQINLVVKCHLHSSSRYTTGCGHQKRTTTKTPIY